VLLDSEIATKIEPFPIQASLYVQFYVEEVMTRKLVYTYMYKNHVMFLQVQCVQ